MKKHLLLLLVFPLLFSCNKNNSTTSRKGPIPDQTEINKLKINQIQTLGSHNSYHKRTDQKILDFLNLFSDALPSDLQPADLDYAHEPLDIQLNTYGMRSFEIDIYADPEGGRFHNRKGNALIGLPEASGIPALNEKGFKVLHIPDIDFNTLFYTFKNSLQQLKDWSDKNPNHIPIFILIEGKEQTIGDVVGSLGFASSVKFTPALCDDLDAEVKSVFGNNLDKIITPDKVRGNYNTLEEAVLANNWPTVGESRGKFIFVMQGESVDDYLVGHSSLKGRVMFTNANEGEPEAAFLQFNDPTKDEDSIIAAIQKGYIIRTRSDEPNRENRTGDYTKQTAAFRSGAQIISTDYYRPDARYLTQPDLYKNYSCQFQNGDLARINPISAADKQGIGKIAE